MIITGKDFLEIGNKDLENRLLSDKEGKYDKFKTNYLKYNEDVNKEFRYELTNEIVHDGTLIFTRQGILEMFYGLVDYLNENDIECAVGDLRIESEKVRMDKGFPGIKEIFKLPIIFNN